MEVQRATLPMPTQTTKPAMPEIPKPGASPPPPTSIAMQETSTKQATDETSAVLLAFKGTKWEGTDVLESIRSKLSHLPTSIRGAAAMPLLEVVTQPDEQLAGHQLSTIATSLQWALKFKNLAQDAVDKGGFGAVTQRALESQRAKQRHNAENPLLGKVLESPTLLMNSKLEGQQAEEANNLLKQFEAGNPSPGIGSSNVGKGIMYLRGRQGTRIFLRQQKDKPIEWLAVVNKTHEAAAFNLIRKKFDIPR